MNNSHVTADRIERALVKVAKLVAVDPAFTPVFERLERDLAEARRAEAVVSDAQRRARLLLAQKAKGSSKAAKCSKDAPAP